MTTTKFYSQVFILESENGTSIVQETFLETYKTQIKFIRQKDSQALAKIKSQDVLILDIAKDTLETLDILGGLLRRQMRPKLLITTYEDQVFQRDDYMRGGPNHILFKPFTLTDLVSSILVLTQTNDDHSIRNLSESIH